MEICGLANLSFSFVKNFLERKGVWRIMSSKFDVSSFLVVFPFFRLQCKLRRV